MNATETPTARQINALRREAEAACDRDMVLICDLAAAAHETADAQGGDLIGPDGAIWTRTAALAACADVIAAASC